VPDEVNRFERFKAQVVCVAVSGAARSWPEQMNVDSPDVLDKVVLVPSGWVPSALGAMRLRALLIVSDNQDRLTHRELAAKGSIGWFARGESTAYMFISPQVADAILRHSGHSLEEVRQRQSRLQEDEGFAVYTGVDAVIDMDITDNKVDTLHYVQAFIPGREVGSRYQDTGMDREMVILLAHYDSLGHDFDGTLYPGANKNASGVAVMLETARLLVEAEHQPYRTVMFVAWAGEEVRNPPSFWNMLRSRPGWLERYRISAAVELHGVGAGTGDILLLDGGTRGRLTEAIQEAASRLNVNTTTLGIGIRGVYTNLYPRPDTTIPYISLTWEGSYATAHTLQDTIENIDPQKLRDAGRTAALAVMYMAHEREY
jgi:hypothetical protein